MATPHLDRNMAAQLLVEAAFESDAVIAHKHNKTTRSIRNYRDRLSSDPELEKLFQQKLKTYEQDWGRKSSQIQVEGLNVLSRLFDAVTVIVEKVEKAPLEPELIKSVAKLMDSLSAALNDNVQRELTREIVNAKTRAIGQNYTNGTEAIPASTENNYTIDSTETFE